MASIENKAIVPNLCNDTCKIYPYIDDGKIPSLAYACATHQEENRSWLKEVKRFAITNLEKKNKGFK